MPIPIDGRAPNEVQKLARDTNTEFTRERDRQRRVIPSLADFPADERWGVVKGTANGTVPVYRDDGGVLRFFDDTVAS